MSKVLIRYWAYDRCLKRQHIKHRWNDLHREANRDLENAAYEPIGKTQFFKDINALKAPPWNAPIETYKERGQSYYRYSEPTFSLHKETLTDVEAHQLKSALIILERFKGMPQFEWVQELIPKITQQFKLSNGGDHIVGFEENVDLKGIEYFGQLFNSILFKKAMLINYKAFTSDHAVEQIIHPYYLKQFNNRWFLFGKNMSFEGITNLALDRIVQVSDAHVDYVDNIEWDFNEYFEDIIGVTKPANKPAQ